MPSFWRYTLRSKFLSFLALNWSFRELQKLEKFNFSKRRNISIDHKIKIFCYKLTTKYFKVAFRICLLDISVIKPTFLISNWRKLSFSKLHWTKKITLVLVFSYKINSRFFLLNKLLCCSYFYFPASGAL